MLNISPYSFVLSNKLIVANALPYKNIIYPCKHFLSGKT